MFCILTTKSSQSARVGTLCVQKRHSCPVFCCSASVLWMSTPPRPKRPRRLATSLTHTTAPLLMIWYGPALSLLPYSQSMAHCSTHRRQRSSTSPCRQTGARQQVRPLRKMVISTMQRARGDARGEATTSLGACVNRRFETHHEGIRRRVHPALPVSTDSIGPRGSYRRTEVSITVRGNAALTVSPIALSTRSGRSEPPTDHNQQHRHRHGYGHDLVSTDDATPDVTSMKKALKGRRLRISTFVEQFAHLRAREPRRARRADA